MKMHVYDRIHILYNYILYISNLGSQSFTTAGNGGSSPVRLGSREDSSDGWLDHFPKDEDKSLKTSPPSNVSWLRKCHDTSRMS